MRTLISLLLLIGAHTTFAQPGPCTGDKFPGLPLATCDQLAAEAMAIQIVAAPEVQQAKAQLAQKWLAVAGAVSEEQMSYLQDAVDELTFQMALVALTTDPANPRLVSIIAAPHHWYGMDVPGSRGNFDNPDTIYRRMPVDLASSYVIDGKTHKLAQIDENFSLYDALNNTISNLSGSSLSIAPDRSYTIAVDGSASSTSGNHIQNTATGMSMFIRSTSNDWFQKYDTMTVQRVGGSAAPAPLPLDQLVTQTVNALTAVFPTIPFFISRLQAVPVNSSPPISLGGTGGLLSSQAQTFSRWQLADDEALLVTVTLGGASYFVCPVTNDWFITTDYINHTQSLNNSQAVANPDGTYTFVISPTDPGVYNWVDTVGMHEGTLNLRWQGLPGPSAELSATMKLVKLSELPGTLPSGTRYVTRREREFQLVERKASYAGRYEAVDSPR